MADFPDSEFGDPSDDEEFDDHLGEQSGGPPADSPWVHPSQLAHDSRVEADRKRSRLLVTGVLAISVGLLFGTYAAMRLLPGSGDTSSVASANSDAVHLALIQAISPEEAGSESTAVVIDDSGHLVTDAASVSGLSRVRVLCGDRYREASVVGHDDDMNLAVLKLDTAYGKPPTTALAESGDPVNVVRYSADGGRKLVPATITSEGAVQRPDAAEESEPHSGLLNLDTPEDTAGVLTDSNGAVVGLIVSSSASETSAQPIDAVVATANEILAE